MESALFQAHGKLRALLATRRLFENWVYARESNTTAARSYF
ncbi:hypothetical protein [Thermofilum pendens]|nr:hypothetical protein [Thermofilum pendens]